MKIIKSIYDALGPVQFYLLIAVTLALIWVFVISLYFSDESEKAIDAFYIGEGIYRFDMSAKSNHRGFENSVLKFKRDNPKLRVLIPPIFLPKELNGAYSPKMYIFTEPK